MDQVSIYLVKSARLSERNLNFQGPANATFEPDKRSLKYNVKDLSWSSKDGMLMKCFSYYQLLRIQEQI